MAGFCIIVYEQNVEFTQFYTIAYVQRISKDRNLLGFSGGTSAFHTSSLGTSNTKYAAQLLLDS
jgi:hypothetical protein